MLRSQPVLRWLLPALPRERIRIWPLPHLFHLPLDQSLHVVGQWRSVWDIRLRARPLLVLWTRGPRLQWLLRPLGTIRATRQVLCLLALQAQGVRTSTRLVPTRTRRPTHNTNGLHRSHRPTTAVKSVRRILIRLTRRHRLALTCIRRHHRGRGCRTLDLLRCLTQGPCGPAPTVAPAQERQIQLVSVARALLATPITLRTARCLSGVSGETLPLARPLWELLRTQAAPSERPAHQVYLLKSPHLAVGSGYIILVPSPPRTGKRLTARFLLPRLLHRVPIARREFLLRHRLRRSKARRCPARRWLRPPALLRPRRVSSAKSVADTIALSRQQAASTCTPCEWSRFACMTALTRKQKQTKTSRSPRTQALSPCPPRWVRATCRTLRAPKRQHLARTLPILRLAILLHQACTQFLADGWKPRTLRLPRRTPLPPGDPSPPHLTLVMVMRRGTCATDR